MNAILDALKDMDIPEKHQDYELPFLRDMNIATKSRPCARERVFAA